MENMLEFNYYNLSSNPIESIEKIGLWPNKVLLINYSIVIVLGLIGNLTTIYLVLFSKKMQQATNIYISNLAVADLLVIFLVIPENSLRLLFIQPPDICRRIFCKITGFTHGKYDSIIIVVA